MRESSRPEVRLILGMLAVVVLPVAATLATVRVPHSALPAENPTPYGYTVSLLIFLVPILAVSRWHLNRGWGYDQKAFVWCAGLLAGLGSVLDLGFAYHFFRFPNRAATLGVRLPAWNWAELSFVPDYIPLEEFGFYILGAIFMVATYLWAEQNWLSEFGHPAYEDAATTHPRLIHLSVPVLLVWGVLLVAGFGLKALTGDGEFPGYFVFIMVGAAGPTVLLIRGVKDFVNWHAMVFAFFALLLLSIVWEATLGVPYGWWTYRSHEMLGIFIHGWAELPLEAVMVWTLGVWDSVLIYEFFRIYHRMELKPRHRFLGAKDGEPV